MRWRETDVRRENTDVRWVGFHPLLILLQRQRRRRKKLFNTVTSTSTCVASTGARRNWSCRFAADRSGGSSVSGPGPCYDPCRGPGPEISNATERNLEESQQIRDWIFIYKHASNGTLHIRHQCRKTSVLSCHRCQINPGVEKMNFI
jgi:hypothetical protein